MKSDVEIGTKIFSITNTRNKNPSKTHKSNYDFTYHLYQNKYTYFIFMYYKYWFLSPLFECPQRAITSNVFHFIKGKHLVYKKVFGLEIQKLGCWSKICNYGGMGARQGYFELFSHRFLIYRRSKLHWSSPLTWQSHCSIWSRSPLPLVPLWKWLEWRSVQVLLHFPGKTFTSPFLSRVSLLLFALRFSKSYTPLILPTSSPSESLLHPGHLLTPGSVPIEICG